MRTISIALLVMTCAAGRALAQTAAEQRVILRSFERVVAAYAPQFDCAGESAPLEVSSGPVIFTLPVSMVFRQLIATALGEGQVLATGAPPSVEAHLMSHDGFSIARSTLLPEMLTSVLPALPAGLEYRLVGRDLVVLDRQQNRSVGVLRDAIGRAQKTTQRH